MSKRKGHHKRAQSSTHSDMKFLLETHNIMEVTPVKNPTDMNETFKVGEILSMNKIRTQKHLEDKMIICDTLEPVYEKQRQGYDTLLQFGTKKRNQSCFEIKLQLPEQPESPPPRKEEEDNQIFTIPEQNDVIQSTEMEGRQLKQSQSSKDIHHVVSAHSRLQKLQQDYQKHLKDTTKRHPFNKIPNNTSPAYHAIFGNAPQKDASINTRYNLNQTQNIFLEQSHDHPQEKAFTSNKKILTDILQKHSRKSSGQNSYIQPAQKENQYFSHESGLEEVKRQVALLMDTNQAVLRDNQQMRDRLDRQERRIEFLEQALRHKDNNDSAITFNSNAYHNNNHPVDDQEHMSLNKTARPLFNLSSYLKENDSALANRRLSPGMEPTNPQTAHCFQDYLKKNNPFASYNKYKTMDPDRR